MGTKAASEVNALAVGQQMAGNRGGKEDVRRKIKDAAWFLIDPGTRPWWDNHREFIKPG